jgi:hypothetical protein
MRGEKMKALVMLAVLLPVFLNGCATYEGSDRSYGGYVDSKDCQAIASDPWAGPTSLPSTCQRINRPYRP